MSKHLELNYSWNGGYFHETLNSKDKFHYPTSNIDMETIEVDKNDKVRFFIDIEESVSYNNDIVDTIAAYNTNWFLESIKFVEWQK